MVVRKTKLHISDATNARRNDSTNDTVVRRKSIESVDHWAFLDEIEAPTWIDLILEVKSPYEDKGNEWFCTGHSVHRCSSRQLISASSCSEDGSKNVDFGTQRFSSPKLPSSVSRSRGKHFNSKEWRQNINGVTLTRQHQVKNLTSKSSWVNSTSGKKKQSKPSEGYGDSEQALVCQSTIAEYGGPSCSILLSNFEDLKPQSSSTAIKEGESNSTSTITSESSEQNPQKSSEAPNQLFGRKSSLLPALRITLRKSCITRQASRVQTNHGRHSESFKSSSSKSSVGSSLINDFDVNNQTVAEKQNKDRTPESRNVMKMSQATKKNVKIPNTSKTTTNTRPGGGKSTALKFTSQETAKTRVDKQDGRSAHSNAKVKMAVLRGNGFGHGNKENTIGRLAMNQKSKVREKVIGGNRKNKQAAINADSNRLGHGNKEITTERLAMNQKSSMRGKVAGDNTKRLLVQKNSDRTKLGKVRSEIEVKKKSATVGQKAVYLR